MITILYFIAVGVMVAWLVQHDYRIHAVFKERMKVLELVSRKALRDILAGKSWEWRLDEYAKVKYDDMLYIFWKPVTKFYDLGKLLRDDQHAEAKSNRPVSLLDQKGK